MEGKKVFIGNYQLMLMVCVYLSVTTLLILPHALAKVSNQNAWITLFYPVGYGLIIGLILFLLMKRVPGQNIFEISKILCGKFIGSLLNIILILYLFWDLVINIRVYADFFSTAILLKTPIEFIILITIGVVMYFGSGTIEEVARVTSLFFPILFIVLLAIPIMLLNEIDLNMLQPILAQGSKASLKGGILGMGAFGDIIVFGAFLNNIKNPRGFYVSMKTGIIIAGFSMMLALLELISVFGYASASKIIFSGWFIVQQVHITDFLDRVDLFIISLWLPNAFIKYIILYLAILVGLGSFTKSKSYQEYNGLLACLVVIVPIISFNNIADVINSYTYGMLPLTFSVQILFFGALLVAIVLRKKNPAPFKDSWKYGRLIWVSLGFCAAAVFLSDVLKHETGTNGLILGIAFFIFFLFMVYFSIREFSKLNSNHN